MSKLSSYAFEEKVSLRDSYVRIPVAREDLLFGVWHHRYTENISCAYIFSKQHTHTHLLAAPSSCFSGAISAQYLPKKRETKMAESLTHAERGQRPITRQDDPEPPQAKRSRTETTSSQQESISGCAPVPVSSTSSFDEVGKTEDASSSLSSSQETQDASSLTCYEGEIFDCVCV